nr:hypothetical protein [Tanacetum cinerariifolium]
MSNKEETKCRSSKVPTGSKTGHSKKRKESISAMDSNPSQPPVSTPVDTGMYKEDHQAIGGPTSLGVTKLKKNKDEAETALLKARPSFPNVEQLIELLVKSLKIEFLNILSSHDFNISLPIELKDPPSKFNDLTEEVKGLKNQVHNLKVELPRELKEIPLKLEDFTKTVTSLTSESKLKTLDALPSLLNKVTNSLNQFAQAITSKKTRGDSVPSGKKALSSEEAVKENTESGFDDDETHLSRSMVKSSRIIKDFVTIEVFRDYSNIMLYTVQEIFFRLHQGPWLDDHARTFSSLLLAEINKRNLNLLKQMRVIEKLSLSNGIETEEGPWLEL